MKVFVLEHELRQHPAPDFEESTYTIKDFADKEKSG
jgi:hypothetical protein